MGVSISCETPRGRKVDITPGGRSAFYTLLDDERLLGCLGKDDIPQLEKLEKEQTGWKNVDKKNSNPFSIILDMLRKFEYVTIIAEH